MRHCLSAFSACVLIVSVAAASHVTLALWPQHIASNLSFTKSSDNVTVIEALNGGVLNTFSMKFNARAEVTFDPLIDSIELLCKSATNLQSSTFDHFFASSSRFDVINAIGIHLRAKLRQGVDARAMNETIRSRIEENVRKILLNISPLNEIHSRLSKGFLAKSLCDLHTGRSRNLPTKLPFNSTVDFPSTCLSSSFSFLRKDSLYSKIFLETNDVSKISEGSLFERALFKAHQTIMTGRYEPKLTLMKLSQIFPISATTEVEYLGAYIMIPPRTDNSFKIAIPMSKSPSDVLLIMSITTEVDFYELKYVWLQRYGKPVALASPTSLVKVQVSKPAAAASLQTAIAGEGFHRRFIMDVKVIEAEVCGGVTKNNTIFVRVPVSNTAYIDLDEIRRMERFGELKLISFAKHIEIERPSSVSSQHVVGLEYSMSSANQLHLEFPIHFRYQAPSESEMFRPAEVIAPDLYLICQNGDFPVKTKVKSSHDDAVRSYFQTWGIFDQASSRKDTFWRPLISKSPLPVTVVLIPVGYLSLNWIVSSVTLFVACMGAVILIWLSTGDLIQAQTAQTNDGASWKGKLD